VTSDALPPIEVGETYQEIATGVLAQVDAVRGDMVTVRLAEPQGIVRELRVEEFSARFAVVNSA
jgi:hypothetical protein